MPKRYVKIAKNFTSGVLYSKLASIAHSAFSQSPLSFDGLTIRNNEVLNTRNDEVPNPSDIVIFAAKESKKSGPYIKYAQGDIIIKRQGGNGYMTIRSDGSVFVGKKWRDNSKYMKRVFDKLLEPEVSRNIEDKLTNFLYSLEQQEQRELESAIRDSRGGPVNREEVPPKYEDVPPPQPLPSYEQSVASKLPPARRVQVQSGPQIQQSRSLPSTSPNSSSISRVAKSVTKNNSSGTVEYHF